MLFTANINPNAFSALLSGEVVTAIYNPPDEANMPTETIFEGEIPDVPVDGTYWMILNGERYLVKVAWGGNDEQCLGSASIWATFHIVG